MDAILGPFILVALSALGGKIRLATVALAARYKSVLFVTVGTTLGMLAFDGLAVFAGERLAHRVSMKWLRVGAAGAFFIFGIVSAWSALSGG